MQFRPLLGATIATAILFAFLMWLGVWQLERLQWKLGLIDQVSRNLVAPPVSLDRALRMGTDAQYHRVSLQGRFDNAKEAYVYGIGVEGAPVYHVVVPFKLDDGRMLLIDRGIVPRDLRNPALRPGGIDNDETKVTGVWRWGDAPGTFTPAPDAAQRVWYVRDVASIAKADGVTLAAPALLEADATPNPGGWPKGGQTVVTFRNEHLQYAITWFLMAAGLLGVYLAYHASRGRLAFGTRRVESGKQ
ncbi:MAG TPA: SURF1 family protein [Rhizomicrobium sp.]|jgi:surfeit locus 1 family protein|nr:SURF1 family protein [Rhizomicrobium sp.]